MQSEFQALQRAQMSQGEAEIRSCAAPSQQEGKQKWNLCLDPAQNGQGQAEDAFEKEGLCRTEPLLSD